MKGKTAFYDFDSNWHGNFIKKEKTLIPKCNVLPPPPAVKKLITDHKSQITKI